LIDFWEDEELYRFSFTCSHRNLAERDVCRRGSEVPAELSFGFGREGKAPAAHTLPAMGSFKPESVLEIRVLETRDIPQFSRLWEEVGDYHDWMNITLIRML